MRTILVAVDFSDTHDGVLATAAALARATGGTVHLIHVEPPDPDFVGYKPGPQYVRDSVAHRAMDHHERIQEDRDGLQARGLTAHSLVVQGPTVSKIHEEARRLQADLIVAGSHGHGAVYDLLLGSVSQGILKHAPCPVLIVPHDTKV
jgi:nucleotide-binding universal stress UspA family protein